jgi:hypothetical protein
MSSASRTSGPSSKRRVACESPDFASHGYLRWSVHTRRSGWRRRTILPRTLYITGCISRRTRPSFSTASIFTTMRRNIPTRTNPFLIGPSLTNSREPRTLRIFLFLCYLDRSTFNPDRYFGDTLTCAESSKLPNAMDRDHWAFGAGCVATDSTWGLFSHPILRGPFIVDGCAC